MIYLSGEISERQFEWRNDPRIYRWTRQNGPITRAHHEKWLALLPNRSDIKMFGIKDNDHQIGTCGLTSIDTTHRRAEFSCFIAPEYQGKGYGREALTALFNHGFKDMDLYKIYGETFYDNPALILFLKLGMRKEGLFAEEYYKDGRRIDCVRVGVNQGEWFELHP